MRFLTAGVCEEALMNYHNILHDDMRNGEGLRVVLFSSGCQHHCPNCHNPQTWDCNSGIHFDKTAYDEIFEQLSKEYISGITFTGGDPLYENNLDNVLALVNEISASYPDKSIWLYTGFTWNQIMYPIVTADFNPIRDELIHKRKEIVKQCDILIDGRYVDELRDITLKWRGSSNQRVIDIQESLKQDKIILHCE